MTVAVTEAIYRAKAEGASSFDGLAKSIDGVTVSQEKQSRATRTSEQGFERLRGTVDPAIRAYQKYQQTVEQVSRYEEAGIGSAQARAQVIDMATRKYMDQVAALQRATQAQDGYNRAQAAGSVNSAGAINQRLGVQNDFGGAARGADVAAYGQELDRLKAKYVPLFAAQQQYKATLSEISMALKTGAITEAQYTAVKDRTKTAFAEQVVQIQRFGVSTGMAKQSMQQLGFQVNDIVTGLVSGQSPFTVMAQQGGQVFQVWQMNRNIFKDVGSAIAGVARALGPLALTAIGFTAVAAAAYGLYSYLKKEAPSAEKLLSEQDRLLKVVKDSYDQATKSATKWIEQSKDVTRLQLLQQELDVRRKLREEVGKSLSSMTTYGNVGDFLSTMMGGSSARQVKEQFAEFEDAIFKLNEGFRSGTPNVKEFADEIAKVALANPALTKLGNELINSVGDASKFTLVLRQIEEAMDYLNGKKLKKDNSLGISTGAEINSYDQLIQRTKDRIDELKEEALYAGKASYAVAALKLQHDAERAAKAAGVSVNQKDLDQRKEELMLAEKMKAQANIRADIEFTSKTLGLSDGDVQIAEKLKALYGNDVPAAMASTEAAAMRMNDAMGQARELFTGFGVSIAQDLRAGLGPMEALTNALNKFADKLLDMVMTKLMQQAFGGMIPSNFSSWFAPQPGSPSFIGPVQPTAHSGGIVGEQIGNRYIHPAYFENAPRYHTGGIVGRERAIIAMDDEEVLTRSDPRHRWNGGGAGGPVGAPAVSMKVNVMNYGSAKVETSEPRKGADGGMEIDVVIDKVMAKNLLKSGSDSNKAMMGGYGLGHNLTRRG